MCSQSFFEEMEEQSKVKTEIVAKYFRAWAMVMIATIKRYGRPRKIAYVDLFAGPGRYKDGTKSTPLLVLEQAIQDPELKGMLVVVLNDRDPDNARELEEAIADIPGIGDLKYKPIVENFEVGEGIAQEFEKLQMAPSLVFIDPWGYKGLTLKLVGSVIKDWGCDCVFFFNYNRINMGLDNPAVEAHLNALFGKKRARSLRTQLEGMPPGERELSIVEALCESLKECGGKYVLPFRFRNPAGTRTNHHLIFVTKAFKGYEIMKEIMAKESTSYEEGVASFEFSPANKSQSFLFALSRPLEDLAEMLLQSFAEQTLTMGEIYRKHNVGTRFIQRNYKEVLATLERQGKIQADPSSEKRRAGTFADGVKVTFRQREPG